MGSEEQQAGVITAAPSQVALSALLCPPATFLSLLHIPCLACTPSMLLPAFILHHTSALLFCHPLIALPRARRCPGAAAGAGRGQRGGGGGGDGAAAPGRHPLLLPRLPGRGAPAQGAGGRRGRCALPLRCPRRGGACCGGGRCWAPSLVGYGCWQPLQNCLNASCSCRSLLPAHAHPPLFPAPGPQAWRAWRPSARRCWARRGQ